MSKLYPKGASALIASISEEFDGANEPVSVEHFAALYGVIAAQLDATQAVFALAMKANPRLIFEDVAVEAVNANKVALDTLATALVALARTYGNTEGPSDEAPE